MPSATASVRNARTIPLWIDEIGLGATRPPLAASTDVDVCIVGGGYSGLWTAYWLQEVAPDLRVGIVEREYCGFGASGRNGGWCEGMIAGSFEAYAGRSSHQEALRLERTLFRSVDDIGAVVDEHDLECGWAKGGSVNVARTTPQADRLRAEAAEALDRGLTEDDVCWLTADEAREKLNATRVQGGLWSPHCAAVHPARLARGLADLVERRGATIWEQTAVTAIHDGRADVEVAGERMQVRAPVVIQATEAYTRDLEGQRLDLLPVYSLMIATEPLADEVFDEIGLGGRPTFNDARHMVIYGQRTADNRLAFGGRGVPYLWGSAIESKAEYHLASHELIAETLVDLLPPVAGAAITHRWGGVLAIPRNWLPGLRFDPHNGRGFLGGYVGEGVNAAFLAGRTMADLIARRDTEFTSLPWVGVTSRRWEPEPLRWTGVRASRRVMVTADDLEERRDKPARFALALSRLLRGG